jgi:hypothetical protein
MRHVQRPANIAVFFVLLVSACLIIALDADASPRAGIAKPAVSVTTD